MFTSSSPSAISVTLQQARSPSPRRRGPSAYLSDCSANTAPTSRMIASGVGSIPIKTVSHLISLLSGSLAVLTRSAATCLLGTE